MKLPPTAAARGFKEQLSRLEPVRTELAPTKFIMRPFRLGVEDYVNQRAGTVFNCPLRRKRSNKKISNSGRPPSLGMRYSASWAVCTCRTRKQVCDGR